MADLLPELLEAVENLPQLSGTEKQVNWANQIRSSLVEETMGLFKRCAENADRCKDKEWYEKALNEFNDDMKDVAYALNQCNLASWWILMRDDSGKKLVKELARAGKEQREIDQRDAELETIAPENPQKPGIVKIYSDTEKISIEYQKDDEFREVVKSLGYRWEAESVSWVKFFDYSTGDSVDRIAEVANRLLNAGFVVKLPSCAKEKAINADYEPQHKLWICRIENQITIKIPYGDDDLYHSAKQIHGAKWVRGKGVVVPAASYDEIRDFAEVNGYKFSLGAEQALQAAEDEYMKAITGAVKVAKSRKAKEVDGAQELEDKLAEEGIIDDLRDED